MELRHLRYFLAVADELSLGKAAEKLHISQPAVSRQIQDLEEELGVTLFHRSPQGMHLAQAGEKALDQARTIVDLADELVETMQGFDCDESTVIRIGYIPTALNQFLSAGLRQLGKQYPYLRPEIEEMTPSKQEVALRKGKLDLALLGHPRPEIKQEFRVEVLGRVPISAVISSDHPLARRKTITLEELVTYPFLSLEEKNFPTRPRMLNDLFAKAGIKMPRIAAKAKGLSELLGLVSANTGVAVLPADVDQYQATDGVVFLKLRKPTFQLTTSAVYPKNLDRKEVLKLVALMKK